jgi:hypothetical protein
VTIRARQQGVPRHGCTLESEEKLKDRRSDFSVFVVLVRVLPDFPLAGGS